MAEPMLTGNAVIGQSGGPTVVINQSLVGCIEGLRGRPGIKKVLGARHAVRGIVNGDFIDLGALPPERLERVARTPSSALLSSRDKPDHGYCERILESFQRHEIRYFFYIGGNDSSDTCRIVNEVAKQKQHELRAFHIPKTIDNDLMRNDHTPGYGSAARYVACALLGDDLDNRALPGIKIDIIMGRHAGFLTAASLLARTHDDDGPHLIYVPEVPFDIDRFVGDVDRVYSRLKRCVIAVSEGIHDSEGTPIAAKLAGSLGKDVEQDAHGNVQLSGSGALGDFLAQLLKDRLGAKLRVRADTLGYLQRSFAGCVSDVDAREARESAREAARLATSGVREGSIAIERISDRPYAVRYTRVELAEVAGRTRTLPEQFLAGTCDINESFRNYVAPLIGVLPEVERL